jgi:uncharacterized membrane protein
MKNKWLKRYFIDALSGMALGLFSTLIIGLIIKQIGSFFPVIDTSVENPSTLLIVLSSIGQFCIKIGQILTVLTGAGIAIGVAKALGVPKLVLYASILTGTVGAYATGFISGTIVSSTGAILLSGPGDPLGALVASLAGAEIGRLVSGKTKVDIIVTPAVTIIVGCLAAVIFGPLLAAGANWLGEGIRKATELQPFWMGIVLSVTMGMILTLPISSAAIAIILGLSGLAGGAATAGCCAQMIGFAVISWKDNGLNGFFAQGLGTSMLQVPNIVKNPLIWIPPTLASAITGPISTVLLKMQNLPAGSGMGTSGLVGPLLTYQAMIPNESGISIIIKMLVVYIILPAILSYGIYLFMHKKGWIKDGDMKLEN